MKAYLMYRNRDFHLHDDPPWGADMLVQDLELDTLFASMANGDDFLLGVARKAMLSGLEEPEEIRYRQDILRDCLAHEPCVRALYGIAVEAIEIQKKSYFGYLSRYPAAVLSGSRELMQAFISVLRKLREIADQHAGKFASQGFAAFFDMLRRELTDEYFVTLERHLQALRFRHGVLISAELGKGNKGTSYVLRKPSEKERNLLKRVFEKKPPSLTFYIAERDEAGARALSELEARGINLVANAVAQSADHVLSFFNMLRVELGFYVGCLNLNEELLGRGQALCYPEPAGAHERRHAFTGLYDVCLALRIRTTVVANDANAEHCDLVVVTGANEGGKSTFLRSIGLAQVMMQAGMMVAAKTFCANVCRGQFTHYKREEDATMTSGKFDEELVRMNDIVGHVRKDSMVLFNESFASTNEREGSEVARQIVQALLEKRVKVFFVTHMYEFAHGLCDTMSKGASFLRAERREGGQRTFRIVPGEPLETSFGEDLYRRIFAQDEQRVALESEVSEV